MTARSRRRYVVRGPDGRELRCPSLSDLHALYAQGFLSPEDEVRPEGSERWQKLSEMAALRGARERRVERRKVLLLLAAAAALALGLALLLVGARR